MKLRLALGLLASSALAGADHDAIAPPAICPNEVPVAGAPCPEPGLVCNYFTGCEQYWPATCETEGWRFIDGCEPLGGSGPAAGGAGGATTSASTTSASTTTTTTATTASTGGAGGAGGFGGAGGR